MDFSTEELDFIRESLSLRISGLKEVKDMCSSSEARDYLHGQIKLLRALEEKLIRELEKRH